MNVTCERCSTEYEFEETLVSHRGTTVKCTSCGHLFKIYRPGPQPAPDSVKPWMLRRREGGVEPLASLGELARMIANGSTGPDDEISRGGMGWKRLGDIQELASFFQAATARQDARQRSAYPTPALGLHAKPTTASPGIDEAGDADAVPQESEQEHDEAIITHRLPAVRQATPESEAREAPGPDQSGRERRVSGGSHGRSGPPFRMERRHWIGTAVVAGAVAAAVGGWLVWPRSGAERAAAVEQPSSDSARVRRFLAEADAALASDRIERFDRALIEYAKALALRDGDPHILASLSRVHALWAQSLRDRTYTAPSRAGGSSDEQDASSPEQARHVREAKRHAQQALDSHPGHAEARIALADAIRLAGHTKEARAQLERADAAMPRPTAEALRVRAWLEIDAAGGDLAAGTELARRAARLAPDMLRVRKLLARCLMAEGDLREARQHLQAVLSRDAEHQEARALLQRLDSIAAAPAADADAATEPDSDSSGDGHEPGGGARPRHGRGRTEPSAAAARQASQQADNPDIAPTYEGYVEHAEHLLEGGSVSRAKHYYRKALGMRSGGSKALTGLGYIALERGAPQAALARFKQAAAQGHPDAHLGLGETYRRLGRKQDALKAYQHYMRIDPRGRGASVARYQIERLRGQLENEGATARGRAPSRARAEGRTP